MAIGLSGPWMNFFRIMTECSHGTHKSEEIFNLADSGHRNVSVSATAKVNFDSFVFTSVESCLDTLMQ